MGTVLQCTLHCTVQYYSTLYIVLSVLQCTLHCTVQYYITIYIALYSTAVYFTLYCTVLQYTFHCNVQYCSILYIVLYSTTVDFTLHCTVVQCTPLFPASLLGITLLLQSRPPMLSSVTLSIVM